MARVIPPSIWTRVIDRFLRRAKRKEAARRAYLAELERNCLASMKRAEFSTARARRTLQRTWGRKA